MEILNVNSGCYSAFFCLYVSAQNRRNMFKLSKKSFDGFNCESKFNLNFEDNAIQTITPIEYKCFFPQ